MRNALLPVGKKLAILQYKIIDFKRFKLIWRRDETNHEFSKQDVHFLASRCQAANQGVHEVGVHRQDIIYSRGSDTCFSSVKFGGCLEV